MKFSIQRTAVTVMLLLASTAAVAFALDPHATAAVLNAMLTPDAAGGLCLANAVLAAQIKEELDGIASKVAEPLRDISARVLELEQKGARRGPGALAQSDPQYLAPILEASKGFQALLSGQTPVCRLELPANFMAFQASLNTGSGTGGVLIDPDRQPGIVTPGQRRMRIRDLLPMLLTVTGSVEYLRETSFTNNAATVSETVEKPESSFAFALASAKVATIAHWTHASKQILDDVAQLQQRLDTRLRYGLAYVEEVQLLRGSGVGNNLAGIYTQATAFSAPVTISSPTRIDTLRLASGQLENSYYETTGFVVHPNDWTVIELLKATDGTYIKSDPGAANARSLWGKPVVVTSAMTEGTFLAGDFQQAAIIFDRQTPTLDIATQDQDDFVKNMVKLRIEERLALATMLPGALVKGDF